MRLGGIESPQCKPILGALIEFPSCIHNEFSLKFKLFLKHKQFLWPLREFIKIHLQRVVMVNCLKTIKMFCPEFNSISQVQSTGANPGDVITPLGLLSFFEHSVIPIDLQIRVGST